ncbi:MAG TPA: thioredoxin domain-containing protein, partial [Thermopolyspora sp.]
RCPVCREFETQGAGAELSGLVQSGYAQVHYTLASFLDDRLDGDGSKRAANTLRAALEEDKFVEYHEVLFRAQPEETVDGFTDEYLLTMASLVEGLRGPDFDGAVRTMKYEAFVSESEAAFSSSEATGTPTMLVSGTERGVFTSGPLAEWVTDPDA